MPINIIGCIEHTDSLKLKTKNLIADNVLFTFCKEVNKCLSGEHDVLPKKYNKIQELAYMHRKRNKKGIGKYSDIFN